MAERQALKKEGKGGRGGKFSTLQDWSFSMPLLIAEREKTKGAAPVICKYIT